MYHKIIAGLQDFFGISRKEARGALVMMLFCVVIIWTPFVFRRWLLPLVPPGNVPPEKRVLDSIAVLLEKQQATRYRSSRRSRDPVHAQVPRAAIKLVDFDPNTATVANLTGVGIPPFIARRIEKFRSKGGQFRRREDLLKIYDFPAALYARLEPHIVIGQQFAGPDRRFGVGPPDAQMRDTRMLHSRESGAHGNDQRAAGAGAARAAFPNPRTPHSPAPGARAYAQAGPGTFDINRCDTTALIRLKGIGSKLAQRILKFRDGLGGFHSAAQFGEVYGLDSLALSEMRKYARVESPVRKIPINSATAAELSQHSYFRNRKQVQTLIQYRNEHGPFRSLDALRDVKVLDEEQLKKIGPYLSF